MSNFFLAILTKSGHPKVWGWPGSLNFSRNGTIGFASYEKSSIVSISQIFNEIELVGSIFVGY